MIDLIKPLFLVIATILIFTSVANAQPNGGAPYAHYDVHAGASWPEGINVGARMRLAPPLSIEGSAGLLPTRFAFTAGLNFHVYPMLDLDPAFSLLGTTYHHDDTRWYAASLLYGFLSLRKTSLHATIRGGASLLYGKKDDGTHSVFPTPAIDLGVAYGF